MIRLTDRDKKIKSFLEEVTIASTSTISEIFFNGSLRSCQYRLRQLVDYKIIKSFRPSIIEENLFYIKNKPRNYKHKLIFSDLLRELHRLNIEVLKYRCPYVIESNAGTVIADGLIVIRTDQVKIFFVEGELSKKLNVSKYESLYYSRREWKEIFPVYPSILCISNRPVVTDHNVLDIRKVNLNFDKLEEIINK